MSNMCGLFLKPWKQYYIRNSIAYTEDENIIKKLHIFSVPLELTEDILRIYFIIKFGSVLGIQLGKDSKSPEPCLAGEVLFVNPLDAAKALESPTHCLDGMEFQVEPSYSWRQPGAYGTPEEQQTPQYASILNVNNDCWIHILQFLQLRDKLRLARTCQRFRAVYQMATARQYTSVNTSQLFVMYPSRFRDVCHRCSGEIKPKLTLWEIRDFYQLSGDEILNLECKLPMMDSDERFGFIPAYCRNLISLYLGRKVLTKETMLKMPTTIEKLDLAKCFQVEEFPIICRHFTNLRKLNLAEAKIPDRMCLTLVKENCCPKLEMLRLSPFEESKCEILAQLPNLKSLTIHSKTGNSGAELTDQLVEHKSELLEWLEFDCTTALPREQLFQVAKLVGLRTLILPIWYGVSEDVLREFAHLKRLENICFNYKDGSYFGILDLFIACPKLGHLSIFGYDKPIEELVLEIAARVRQELASGDMQRKMPIELGLPYDILNPEHNKVPGSEDVVKIQFNFWCGLSDFRPEHWC